MSADEIISIFLYINDLFVCDFYLIQIVCIKLKFRTIVFVLKIVLYKHFLCLLRLPVPMCNQVQVFEVIEGSPLGVLLDELGERVVVGAVAVVVTEIDTGNPDSF